MYLNIYMNIIIKLKDLILPCIDVIYIINRYKIQQIMFTHMIQ